MPGIIVVENIPSECISVTGVLTEDLRMESGESRMGGSVGVVDDGCQSAACGWPDYV
jgi:hypothetical protein